MLFRSGCGNTSTISRTINWTYDVTPPTISLDNAAALPACNPTTTQIEASLGTAAATDGCGEPAVTYTDGTVSSNSCLRSQTRTFTATDGCGNTSTISRTINWTYDVTPPTISLDNAATLPACNPTTTQIEASLGTASATDG